MLGVLLQLMQGFILFLGVSVQELVEGKMLEVFRLKSFRSQGLALRAKGLKYRLNYSTFYSYAELALF